MAYPALTLLSPARDLSVAKSAIQAGADAIYIGAPRFGARQSACNSLEDIAQVVHYAHRFGVQVLVTLNTLLSAQEREEAAHLAWSLYRIGVDALIIQDLRLLDCVLPPIRLHASTQCDNRTADQIIRLQRLGFRRAVLARELSLDEIRTIHEAVLSYSLANGQEPIELEAFVHGALCVSYSGRCYMSEVLMGRSANRGACAQMCRMQYDLLDATGREIIDPSSHTPIHQRYLLSLQDMDRSAHLLSLIEAGVTTFKIEGRLKDAAYVSNITAFYRERLSSFRPQIDSATTPSESDTTTPYESKNTPNENATPSETPSTPIPCRFSTDFTPSPAKTFHRGGTDYFLFGRNAHMANFLTPKSTGESIGRVLALTPPYIDILLDDPTIVLHNGDGLCFADQGFLVNGTSPLDNPTPHIPQTHKNAKNKPHNATSQHNTTHTTSPQAPTTLRILPNLFPASLRVGDRLFRNLDTDFVKSLRCSRRIPLHISLQATETGFALSMQTLHGPMWQASKHFDWDHTPANNAPRALQTLREQLSKLGDTDYFAHSLFLPATPYFIPISALNAARRELISLLDEAYTTFHQSHLSSLIQTTPHIPTDTPPTPTPTQAPPTPSPLQDLLSPEEKQSLILSLLPPSDISSQPLMHCRYCLLHEIGHCRKQAPLSPEPQFLRLRNGITLRLHFDCATCSMTITKA